MYLVLQSAEKMTCLYVCIVFYELVYYLEI